MGAAYLTTSTASWAEGSAEIGTNQTLRSATSLYVDIVNSAIETISWTGSGSIRVIAPGGAEVGTFPSGSTITPTMNGAYRLEPLSDQTSWDISVLSSGVVSPGRLWSTNWLLDGGGYAEVNSATNSFYALVNGGSVGSNAVTELKFEGLAGYIYSVTANDVGVDGNTTRSTPKSGNTYSATTPLYVNPPAIAQYNPLSPELTSFEITRAFPGDYEFSFDTNVDGICHVIIDADMDGLDITDSGDAVISVPCAAGSQTIRWDGTYQDGSLVPPGDYAVVSRIHVGEVHYIGDDIETSFPGLRMFAVDAGGTRTPLAMFWNDGLVQANAIQMPDGQYSPVASGPDGLDSGVYSGPAVPNANSRAWGAFTDSGKGNDALLNTFSWLYDHQSTELLLTISSGPGPSDEPDILVSPGTLSFGDTLVGMQDQRQITISNEGTANLDIALVGGANGLTSPFSFGTDNCSQQSLAPEGSCTIQINFQPSASGTFNDTFNVPSNDPDSPNVTVAVGGTGIEAMGVGGTAYGLSIKTVNCRNKTTRQKVSIRLDGAATEWDCEAAGLVVNPGDQIDMTVKGYAD